jgi:hypothetical protein
LLNFSILKNDKMSIYKEKIKMNKFIKINFLGMLIGLIIVIFAVVIHFPIVSFLGGMIFGICGMNIILNKI